MTWPRRFAAAALVLVIPKWNEPCNAQVYEVQDSAGIAVVTTAPNPGAAPWLISKEPVITIGKVEGEQPYLFTQIWDALRTPDGRIVVVEGSAYEIRVFGREGRHLATFGGRGGGPNEFGGPPWIALAGSDTVVVWDPGHLRISHYSLDGELLSQHIIRSLLDSLAIRPFPNGLVWRIARDGSLLWTGQGRARREPQRVTASTSRFVLIPPDRTGIRDLGEYADGQTSYAERSGGGLAGMASPFAPSSTAALGPTPDHVAISDSQRWEIRFFDGLGRLRKIWRGRFPRAPVTPAMVAAARRENTAAASRLGLTRKQAEEVFGRIPMPDSVPAIGVMIWDAAGNFWIGTRAGKHREISEYQVLDQHGRWLSTVIMPSGLGQIFDIGADYLLAEKQDEVGVQYLQMYRIRKPAR